MTTTKTTPKCWVNPKPFCREESETPQLGVCVGVIPQLGVGVIPQSRGEAGR